ncbi:MAG TPA: pyrroloquinoline quinone-dependent dehydrogenase [Croceibacterium sp.]|nr:pyrroloquinoline quinone-dependent dehydrogenase [Croceibacterium sp.]
MHHPHRGIFPGPNRLGFVSRLALALAAGVPLAACAATGPVASSGPVKAEFDYAGWDSYAGGADSSQYSSLDQVNTDNVTQLELAWSYPTGDGPPPSFNPLKVGDTLYLVNGNKLVALDPATGVEKWNRAYEGRSIGSRGMNYWQSADGSDRRLFFLMDGVLRAVNAADGAPIASFGDGGGVDIRTGLAPGKMPERPLQTSNPGRIYKNTIIVSLPAAAYDFASAPADIHAYDVVTGKLRWVFHTVPEKGEFGYDTWPEKDHEKFGGVHNWSELTIDTNTGIAYIPTGTARYDFYGGNREGDNLFANSLVALDAETGKRIWHFQVLHHDLWDWDIPQSPKLLTIHKDGKDIPVVIQATKFGYIYVFDRRTGKPIWPIEEKPVPKSDVPGEKPSPTQPVPTWPEPFARQGVFTEDMINPYISDEDKAKLRELLKTARNEGLYTPPSLQGSISLPGHNGGANWGSSAVDPLHRRYFVVSKQLPTFDKLILDKRPEAQAAMPNGGGDVKPYKSNVDFMLQSNGLPAIEPPWSLITAYDMDTGKKIWSLPNGEVTKLVEQGVRDTGSTAPRGGPVATAGGLVFVGTSSDRKFRARDAATGKVLWEFSLPAASEGIPAVYEAGGRQYVVIPVGGDGLFAPKLGQTAPGPSQYMAFALPQSAR